MKSYLYVILLLFMFLLVYEGIKKAIKYAPSKIKRVCIFIFLCMICKYTTLFILLTSSNIRYLYLLSPFNFLNLICIPLSALVVIYILIRNDKINFSYMFFITTILTILYTLLIYKHSVKISISDFQGYFVSLCGVQYIYVIYMLLNVLFIIFSLNYYNKSIYKKGIILVIIASLSLIIEVIMYLLGASIFETLIISDILWMITLNYGINKLKKSGI